MGEIKYTIAGLSYANIQHHYQVLHTLTLSLLPAVDLYRKPNANTTQQGTPTASELQKATARWDGATLFYGTVNFPDFWGVGARGTARLRADGVPGPCMHATNGQQ